MENSLSHIQKLFISNMLSTHTAHEMAVILDKPIQVVRGVINELTGIHPKRKIKEQILREKAEKKQVKKHNVKLRRRADRANEEDQAIKVARELATLRRNKRLQEQSFQTRKVDYTKYVSVRIDHRTVIQVPAGTDIGKAKDLYLKTHKPLTSPKI